MLWSVCPSPSGAQDDVNISTDEESISQPIAGPRDLLDRYGIDQSHFANLTDGVEIHEGEFETILSVMFRIRRCRTIDIEDWARDKLEVQRLAAEMESLRGEMYPLKGRIVSVEVLEPWAEVVEPLELEQNYRCELLLDDGQPAAVYVPSVPDIWRDGGQFDDRVGALGLLLKLESGDPARPMPVFVAQRIARYPKTPLGDLDMDVGLLDGVKDQRPVAHWERGRTKDFRWMRTGWEQAYWERECFYQMLAAVGRAKPGQLLREAEELLESASNRKRRADGEAFSVVPLFNDVPDQRGRLVVLSGIVRRVERIRVEDPDVRARFGIDHFYQLALFTPDSQNNPVFFCVRQLPKGMPLTLEPDYAEEVRVAGFFMKTWSYETSQQKMTADGKPTGELRRQLAPLLFGREPVWYRQGTGKPSLLTPTVELIAGCLFVVAMLGVWLGVWQYGRGDRQFHDRTLARIHTIDSPDALEGIDEQVDPASEDR